ncbi:MAG TPA: isoprenylcysteine carboxylmethyltransferase family protein [Thermoanaerobaculia bacterium]|jgi:protein-S-isoprenylcysteine O-methyltransferase Ste14
MGRQIFALARSIIVSIIFVSIWTWFIPRWIAGGKLNPQLNWPAIVLMSIGGVIVLRCVFDFAWRGLGTPAPFDPPRRLVVTGLYRWVRNPMYVGMGIFLVGEALLLPSIRGEMLIMVAILWVVVTLFIIVYEEPTLRRTFGDDYERYRRNVHRWLPRLTPFDNQTAAAVH